MIRRFNFESDIYETFYCVPMAVRRKLDRLGLKIGLAQWQKLRLGERLAVCHLPADSQEECDALRLFIREAVFDRTGSEPKVLDAAERTSAEPPAEPPRRLVENARAEGIELDQSKWTSLDADQRYALCKLGGTADKSHNFGAALREFFAA
jgi:hypothetical protein